MRHERGLAVVENDCFFLVEPTLRVINLGADGVCTGRADLIPELSALGIEHLAFPGNQMCELGGYVAYWGVWRENGRPVTLS
jgi:hypothetical protein